MIEYLDAIDQSVFLAINGSHIGYFDWVMWCVSSRLSWTLILVAFLLALRNKGWKHALLIIMAVALAILVADQISSGFIKHAVERLRPSHNPSLENTIHIVKGYRGGMYGFVSSHAANSFAVSLLLGLVTVRKRVLFAMMAWAVLQCYSRVYLGVHYPGDILGGAVVGLLSGWLVYRLWLVAERRLLRGDGVLLSERDATWLAHSVWLSVTLMLLMPVLLMQFDQ